MGAGILLRCPTNVLGDNAPSSLVDRCHSLPNSNIFFTYRQEQNCCFPVLEFSLSSMANSDLSNCSVRLSSQPRHCEPVRRLVWQSVLLFGKAGVIATFLGDADCHVASLLAMTWKFVRYRVNFKQFDKSEFTVTLFPLSTSHATIIPYLSGKNLPLFSQSRENLMIFP